MISYLNLLRDVMENGEYKDDRTNTGTLSVFGRQVRFNLLDNELPAVTTKLLYFRSIIHELLWFIKGDTNIKYLNDNNVHIWDSWADENGNLGPVYGSQWRNWNNSVDQLSNVIDQIKTNPQSRRLIVSSWNVDKIDDMALPPCHTLFQFYINNGYLSCQLYQRSADIFLGVPFNIVSYAILTHMVAQVTGLVAKEFIHTFGDLHLYYNHIEQAKIQLSRKPLPPPKIELNKDVTNLFDFKFDDIKINDYISFPPIPAPIAV